jgi:hypothetical protein
MLLYCFTQKLDSEMSVSQEWSCKEVDGTVLDGDQMIRISSQMRG